MSRCRLSLGPCLLVLACAPPPDQAISSYLDDAGARRAELVAALVNPDNLYARLRLAHYATGDADDWDRLPEWNPPVEPIAPSELDAPGGAVVDRLSAAVVLALPAAIPPDELALVALGRAAFARYPTQIAPYLAVALSSRRAATKYGLWIDGGGVGGLVRARMADGSATVALTCSTCHSGFDARGALAPGLPNRVLDLGRALAEAPGAATLDSSWGPGRVDVTTAAGSEPARIPDLRAVRWQSFLQQDATLRGNDLTVLAIRIETLIVTAGQEALRPPRLIALALAAYVRSLGVDLPSAAAAREAPRGAALFARSCVECHAPPALTGQPVALAVIGTDPTLGLSPNRGTGAYRVPSLHGVGTRGPLLHDGTLPSLEALFDPGRLGAPFTNRLHGSGAVPGHVYGLDLPVAARNDLIDYLRRL